MPQNIEENGEQTEVSAISRCYASSAQLASHAARQRRGAGAVAHVPRAA